jgi:hypothetical protein
MTIKTPAKLVAVLALLLSSCGGATTDLAGGVGSNTNWLTPCVDGGSCGGDLSCLCGVCTTSCSNTACSSNTQCVVPSSGTCASTSEPVCVALCASDTSCVASLGEGFVCVAGRCEAQPESGGIDTTPRTGSPDDSISSGGNGGDGAGGSTADTGGRDQVRIAIGSFTNSPPPAECVQGLPPLLPDCDPSVLAYSGLDCDADGVPDYRVWRCELASAERPPDFSGSYDCEPNDPGLRYWVTRDSDGDGFGDGNLSCAGPTVPEGYLVFGVSPTDCDLQNPAIHPGALETWGDGVDSDCSYDDGPNCNVLTSGAEAYVRSSAHPTNCAAGQPDTFLSSVVHCGSRCPAVGALYFFVGNAGTVDAPGPISVSWSDDTGASGTIEVSAGALAPGETTAPFAVPTNQSTRTEVSVNFQDCDPENGKFVDDNPSGNKICI